MKFCMIASLIAICSVPCAETMADDALALQYAVEAVDSLQVHFDRMVVLHKSSRVPATEFNKLKLQLLDAKLTLFRLRGDDGNIQQLLQEKIDRETDRFKRTQELAKRGATNSEAVRVAELHLLMARQEFAIHMSDKEAASNVLRRAITLEEEKLEQIVKLPERGYVYSRAIAKQKLRIAKLVATQRIVAPIGI